MHTLPMLLPLIFALTGCEVAAPTEGTQSATPVAAEESTMPANPADGAKPEEGAAKEIEKIKKTEREWRRHLTREEYRILRKKGTERAFTGEYDHHFEPGGYACAACGLVLFESDTKFNSGCGWPAFYAAKAGDRVVHTPDYTHGMVRVEVTCARCDGHLGHIFDDAPQTPTGQRYCINSVSLDFIPKAELEKRIAEQSSQAKAVGEKEQKTPPDETSQATAADASGEQPDKSVE